MPAPAPITAWTLARIGFVIVVAVVWENFSHVLAVKIVGLVTLAHAGIHLYERKIPYGWSGQEPSGYITGGLAVVLAVLLALIGTLFLVGAHIVVDILEAPRR